MPTFTWGDEFIASTGRFDVTGAQTDVTTSEMTQVVQQYIEQETGKAVVITSVIGETVAHLYGIPYNPVHKQLLLRAYAWAVDHLKQ